MTYFNFHPPLSPDLTAADNFLCSNLNNKVYPPLHATNSTPVAATVFTTVLLGAVWKELFYRWDTTQNIVELKKYLFLSNSDS
jgi:hypothetical protein